VIDFIIHSLAVWRICTIVNRENGPYLILERIRLRAGAWRDDMGLIQSKEGSIADLLTCLLCLSVWLGIATALYAGKSILYGFAISAACMFIESIYTRIKFQVTQR